MQMKINLNKIFQFQNSNNGMSCTTSLQQSYREQQQPSILYSHHSNQKLDYHYKFNEALFDSDQYNSHNNTKILNDLSLLGRSLQHSIQKNKKNKNQDPQNYVFFNNNNQSNKKITPGERLYYQCKIKKQKKQKQIEKMKEQMNEQQQRQLTFKPYINPKSIKLIEQAESPIRKVKRMTKQQAKKEPITKSYIQLKQEEQLKNCTFKPFINNKSIHNNIKNKFISTMVTDKSNGKVFDHLYNDHKLRQIKRKIQLQQEQQAKRTKKMTKQQLQQFFQKNQQYLNQRQKRSQILKQVSSQYDLTSGIKLFSPKVKDYNPVMFHSNSSAQFSTPPSIKKKQNNKKQNQRKAKNSNKGIKSTNQQRFNQISYIPSSNLFNKAQKSIQIQINASNHQINSKQAIRIQTNHQGQINDSKRKKLKFQQMKEQIRRRKQSRQSLNAINLMNNIDNQQTPQNLWYQQNLKDYNTSKQDYQQEQHKIINNEEEDSQLSNQQDYQEQEQITSNIKQVIYQDQHEQNQQNNIMYDYQQQNNQMNQIQIPYVEIQSQTIYQPTQNQHNIKSLQSINVQLPSQVDISQNNYQEKQMNNQFQEIQQNKQQSIHQINDSNYNQINNKDQDQKGQQFSYPLSQTGRNSQSSSQINSVYSNMNMTESPPKPKPVNIASLIKANKKKKQI